MKKKVVSVGILILVCWWLSVPSIRPRLTEMYPKETLAAPKPNKVLLQKS